jgi:deoxyribodipyrimidine photo-lyase
LILKGKPELKSKIAAQYKAQKWQKEVAYEEKQTEKRVQEALFKIRCELRLSTSTMYHAEDLPLQSRYSRRFYAV